MYLSRRISESRQRVSKRRETRFLAGCRDPDANARIARFQRAQILRHRRAAATDDGRDTLLDTLVHPFMPRRFMAGSGRGHRLSWRLLSVVLVASTKTLGT